MKARLTLVFEEEWPGKDYREDLIEAVDEGNMQRLYEEFDGLDLPTEMHIVFID